VLQLHGHLDVFNLEIALILRVFLGGNGRYALKNQTPENYTDAPFSHDKPHPADEPEITPC